jgi:hypothetical protein
MNSKVSFIKRILTNKAEPPLSKLALVTNRWIKFYLESFEVNG